MSINFSNTSKIPQYIYLKCLTPYLSENSNSRLGRDNCQLSLEKDVNPY